MDPAFCVLAGVDSRTDSIIPPIAMPSAFEFKGESVPFSLLMHLLRHKRVTLSRGGALPVLSTDTSLGLARIAGIVSFGLLARFSSVSDDKVRLADIVCFAHPIEGIDIAEVSRSGSCLTGIAITYRNRRTSLYCATCVLCDVVCVGVHCMCIAVYVQMVLPPWSWTCIAPGSWIC